MIDFFRLNMSYGMEKNKEGKWMVFNRYYAPLGLEFKPNDLSNYFIEYENLTDEKIKKIIDNDNFIETANGIITRVWFYDDNSTPSKMKLDKDAWNIYQMRISKLTCIKGR